MDSFYFEVIELFNRHNVQYMVVGGFAVNFHGYNRSTGDLDLWVSNSDKNLLLLKVAVDELGFELSENAMSELRKDQMVTFSNEDCVIELMTRLNISIEISFKEAFERAELRTLDNLVFRVISLADLKNEKSRSKRYKDLDDLSKLEEAEVYYGKRSKEE